MPTRESNEYALAFREAQEIAESAGQPLNSAHVLLALFTYPNRAQLLLRERNITEDTLLEQVRGMGPEPAEVLDELRQKAKQIATGSNARELDCLHLLVALSRVRRAAAYDLLEKTGISVTSLRNTAMSYLTTPMPRRFREVSAPAAAPVAAPYRRPPQTTEEVREAPVARVETPRAAPASAPASTPPRGGLQPLDPKKFPVLTQIGRDLTMLAQAGELDDAVLRERETEALIDVLGKRRSNNPCLVGEPGVGKTAIVEGLAVRLARSDPSVVGLRQRRVVQIDAAGLVAGTSLRGSFSEKLNSLKDEVRIARDELVVFIDELHTLVGAGSSGDGPQDAANELKAALARGEFPCIGATTHDEYKKYVEGDAALERRFTPVDVREPTVDEAVLILEGTIPAYAEHHGVAYTYDAVEAACRMSHRYIVERKLPDKAFALVDLAGSRARRQGLASVERDLVAEIVSERTGVPRERLMAEERSRLKSLEQEVERRFVGHGDVVASVCEAVRRGYAGFGSGRRPMASFLFLGPTGVGKTELVAVLAECLFGRRDAVLRFDMSEYHEAHTTSRLIGAPPGFVGYGEGGQLTDGMRRRPFQIVLFDEVEKAHHDVLSLLLQILDEGTVTDAKGRKVSFQNAIVAMTSNAGSALFARGRAPVGFAGAPEGPGVAKDAVLTEARRAFAPELWSRVDERLVFAPLTFEDVRSVARLQLQASARALFNEHEITLHASEDVVDVLLSGDYDLTQGARPMRRIIERLIEAQVADALLDKRIAAGDTIRAAVLDGRVQVEVVAVEEQS